MMQLLRSRALLSAWKIGGHCGEARYTPAVSKISSLRTGPQQWSRRRTLTTTATAPILEPRTPQDEATKESTIPLSDQIRLLMRRVPYPVAIITSTDPHGPLEKAFRGMTVSSFNTVTLQPAPVISFNVRRPSETLSALLSSQRFLVHLLSPHQATAALARDFSRGNHNLAIMAGKSAFEFTPLALSEEDAAARPLPLLRRKQQQPQSTGGTPDDTNGSEFFPFVFECRLLPQRVDVYDHTIVVGTVVRALPSSSAHLTNLPTGDGSPTTSASELCLTYANTRFWEMGHEI